MIQTTPGWLSSDELELVRARMPILYVEAVPVRVDENGEVTSVGLLLPNRAECLAACFGTAMVGGVLVPLSTFATPEELEQRIDAILRDDLNAIRLRR